ncbi:MAG TPA: shikimate kinase, partial [Thermoanaerobaculia bacterium]
MRIYLTGFMGSGKSTVGRLLAERLGMPFIDLDAEIEQRAGITVREIFERHGEPVFRRLEQEALRATEEMPDAVVATGGG